ncbi:hypothetical protein [Flavobacterium laiguense]|uniref:hypothetical protein n=1 Tax=Flavobacterium laiguense TaxID=2169409 RepID=UPI001670659A|nr:hypothetical protein [Flavobacterium laiguense]
MKTYTLYQLQSVLQKLNQGDLFKINGQLNSWEFWDENKDYYFIKNNISKQKILIQKLT